MDVLQAIALSAHGAAFIKKGDRAPELLTTHSTFRTVHAVEFRRTGAMHGGLVADSVAPWMRRLHAEGVVMIRPVLSACSLPNESSDAAWGILTDGDRGMELWRPHWRARMAGHGDLKPHRVTYTAERMSRWHLPPVLTLDAAAETLTSAILKSAERLKESGRAELAFPLVRCLDLQRERQDDFADASDLWPDETAGRHVAASALRIACLAHASLSRVPADQAEIYGSLWKAAMQGFEAAVPTVVVAKAA